MGILTWDKWFHGIDLYRKTTVGDNPLRIAQAIKQSMERCDIILTTGGLGPTVDDPTREAVALALKVRTIFQPELWEQIQARFRRFGRIPTENNRRQAYIPSGAIAVENPVGTAPAFIAEHGDNVIIALPGVPREMEYLLNNTIFEYLRQRFNLTSIIKARVIHTAGAGESQIDELIGDLEKLNNPTVGMAAHSGQVDVRITAKAESEPEADKLIEGVEIEIRERLGKWIYGADGDKLEEVALRAIMNKNWSLTVIEAGLNGELLRRIAAVSQNEKSPLSATFRGGEILTDIPDPDELILKATQLLHTRQADVCLGVTIQPGEKKQRVHIVVITPDGHKHIKRPYGGPPGYAPIWALHHSLNMLRNL